MVGTDPWGPFNAAVTAVAAQHLQHQYQNGPLVRHLLDQQLGADAPNWRRQVDLLVLAVDDGYAAYVAGNQLDDAAFEAVATSFATARTLSVDEARWSLVVWATAAGRPRSAAPAASIASGGPVAPLIGQAPAAGQAPKKSRRPLVIVLAIVVLLALVVAGVLLVPRWRAAQRTADYARRVRSLPVPSSFQQLSLIEEPGEVAVFWSAAGTSVADACATVATLAGSLNSRPTSVLRSDEFGCEGRTQACESGCAGDGPDVIWIVHRSVPDGATEIDLKVYD